MKHNILAILTILGCLIAALPAMAENTVDIPLYDYYINSDGFEGFCLSEDNPGSSTVDPIDPNQAKAELTGSTLVVQEHVDGVVVIEVINADNGQSILSTSFDNMLTLQLVDTATYVLRLKFENGRTVYGRFDYPINIGRKEMKNGQLYIRFGGKLYAIPGTKIR